MRRHKRERPESMERTARSKPHGSSLFLLKENWDSPHSAPTAKTPFLCSWMCCLHLTVGTVVLMRYPLPPADWTVKNKPPIVIWLSVILVYYSLEHFRDKFSPSKSPQMICCEVFALAAINLEPTDSQELPSLCCTLWVHHWSRLSRVFCPLHF